MRRLSAATAVLLLALLGLSNAPGNAAEPATVFAPYADQGLYPRVDLAAAMDNVGIKRFHLAFIRADDGCTAAWSGYDTLQSRVANQIWSDIQNVRRKGGDVTVSFGGSYGRELAL